jgi:hypothetical protein
MREKYELVTVVFMVIIKILYNIQKKRMFKLKIMLKTFSEVYRF